MNILVYVFLTNSKKAKESSVLCIYSLYLYYCLFFGQLRNIYV